MPEYYRTIFLENGGSDNMAINGSGTPVLFEADFSAYSSFTVTAFEIYIETNGNPNAYTKFLSINGGLSNGLIFDFSVQGNVFQSQPIQSTRDLFKFFDPESYLLRRSIGSVSHFKGIARIPIGTATLASTSDYFRLEIQDNLTQLEYMAVSLKGVTL